MAENLTKISAFAALKFGFSQFQTEPNTVSVPGYALLDAQTSYDFDRYTISVSAVNLTGRKVFETYQYMGSPVVLPTQPRSAYLTLTARF